MNYLRKIFRVKRFKILRQEKTNRIVEVKKYLDEWSDIPMRELHSSCCEILKIKNNKAAQSLIFRINISDGTPEELSRYLP